ncbi:MAG: flagellar biosynthesis protein FliQ [Betaproteobacteria bacterium]|jgi:flagellar biosynthetic protein FliQ|nr:flagellar biosynthesis protein FliQ [Betaproteobacteria bacterium]
MDTAAVVDLAREALMLTMLVSLPLLAIALGVGLLIGVFQAATSINEMTLSFIPKLVAIGLAMAIFGGWQINLIVEFTRSIFQRIPGLFV